MLHTARSTATLQLAADRAQVLAYTYQIANDAAVATGHIRTREVTARDARCGADRVVELEGKWGQHFLTRSTSPKVDGMCCLGSAADAASFAPDRHK